MTPRTGTPTLTGLALVLALSGALVLASASSASAAVTQPGDGAVYTSESTTIPIRADYGPSGSREASTLTLTSPAGGAVVVDSGQPTRLEGGQLAYDLSLDCWTFPSAQCSGRRPAPNGTWSVEQSGGSRVGFTVRIAPQRPHGVAAAARSAREVEVSWQRGAEPDLTGFAVFEGEAVVKDSLGLGVCDGATCRTVIDYGAERPGRHSYVVRSYRSTGPGSSETLGSPDSESASATLTASPPPPSAAPAPGEPGPDASPGAAPGAGGSGSSGPGTASPGSGTGPGSAPGPGTPSTGSSPGSSPAPAGAGANAGTGAGSPVLAAPGSSLAQRRAFSSGFAAFGPELGVPKLPPLPQGQAPSVATPLPDGTFKPTLGFQDQVVKERVEARGPAARVNTAVENVLDSDQLVRSTAGALLLLLAGAHLRRWIAAAPKQ